MASLQKFTFNYLNRHRTTGQRVTILVEDSIAQSTIISSNVLLVGRAMHHVIDSSSPPTSPESTTANFDDYTAVAMDSDPAIASQKLQTDLLAI
jgi:hypothetical protein